MIAVWSLAAIAIFILSVACFAYRKAFYVSPRQKGNTFPLPGGEQYRKVQAQTRSLMQEMEALPCEQVSITASDGIKLFARYYHVCNGAPLQIQFHGYRGTYIRDFCGGHKLARESGHNTLVVDQRAHGKSGGNTIAFGILERYDCLSWVDYAVKRFGNEVPIFLSGVSMGGTTVLMATEFDLPGNVLGVIADSPYNSPEAIIRKVCRDMHLSPALIFPFIRLGAKLFGRFDITAASATRAVEHTKIPILIIHGEDDRFVPCEMSAEIRDASREMVVRETFPLAGHGLSCIIDPDRYSQLVGAFIQRCCSSR